MRARSRSQHSCSQGESATPLSMPFRGFTVQGPQLALAMLYGHKTIETRKCAWWPRGWYFLHVGRAPLSQQGVRLLNSSWPDAPPESELHRSAIYGLVRLGPVVPVTQICNPWAQQEFGEWSYVLEETLAFRAPLLGVRGQLGLWYMREEGMQVRLANAVLSAQHRVLSATIPCPRLSLSSTPPLPLATPWLMELDHAVRARHAWRMEYNARR